MSATGWVLAGTVATENGPDGSIPWTSPDNVKADDDALAQSSAVSSTKRSDYILATNFGLTIPSGAQILGVRVRIKRRGSTDPGVGGVVDYLVQLINGGSKTGDNNADVSTVWPTTIASVDYGAINDTWGITLTQADASASDFGVAFVAAGATSTTDSAFIDAIWINVEYGSNFFVMF